MKVFLGEAQKNAGKLARAGSRTSDDGKMRVTDASATHVPHRLRMDLRYPERLRAPDRLDLVANLAAELRRIEPR